MCPKFKPVLPTCNNYISKPRYFYLQFWADTADSRSNSFQCSIQIRWVFLMSRQGKVRLAKWFESFTEIERNEVMRDVQNLVLPRSSKMCNVVDRKQSKIVYKRYASLFFIACIDQDDNELITMELLHLFVECLDTYFGNVCELDIIFNFTRAYWILNEIFSAGELLEPNKASILSAVYSKDAAAEPVPEFPPKNPGANQITPPAHNLQQRRY